MSETDSVNIRIKKDTWKRLHHRKGPGDSFDDVIREALDSNEDDDAEGNLNQAAAD